MWVSLLCLRDRGRRLTQDELAAARPFVGRLSVDAGHERWSKRPRSALLYDPVAARALAELSRVLCCVEPKLLRGRQAPCLDRRS